MVALQRLAREHRAPRSAAQLQLQSTRVRAGLVRERHPLRPQAQACRRKLVARNAELQAQAPVSIPRAAWRPRTIARIACRISHRVHAARRTGNTAPSSAMPTQAAWVRSLRQEAMASRRRRLPSRLSVAQPSRMRMRARKPCRTLHRAHGTHRIADMPPRQRFPPWCHIPRKTSCLRAPCARIPDIASVTPSCVCWQSWPTPLRWDTPAPHRGRARYPESTTVVAILPSADE